MQAERGWEQEQDRQRDRDTLKATLRDTLRASRSPKTSLSCRVVDSGGDRGLDDRMGGGEWENGGGVSAEELEMLSKLESLLAVRV